ncbi:MAG: hypothetical protein ACOYXA_14445 [Bacteroidota bacterium]
MIRYQNGDKDVFEESSSPEKRPLHARSFSVNPLGVLQFGPIFQWEVQAGANSYFVPHFRYGYLGVLTHLVWTGFDDEDRLSPATFGLGAGIRGFAPSQNSSNATYYGGLAEISFGKANYGVGQPYETEERATNLGLIGNVGYRWRYPSQKFLNLGLLFGAVFTISDVEQSVVPGYNYYQEYSEIIPFAMLELSFGWEKGKR